jgi:hypothetical protein
MMKKNIITIFLLLTISCLAFCQKSTPLVGECIMNIGEDAKYLKDFRIQLGKTVVHSDLRYKANMSLWKNTKYRFTMCNTEDSPGKLILSIKDNSNKIVLSSFNEKTGKTYSFVDFICNKSGIYQLNFDFTQGQQGSGVGVVSMIK